MLSGPQKRIHTILPEHNKNILTMNRLSEHSLAILENTQ